MGNIIEIYAQKKEYEREIPTVKKYITALFQYFHIKNAHLALFFVSPQKMRVLNRKFRGKDRATNVLTFVEPSDFIHPSKKTQLGELYINLEYIKKHKQSLAHMIVHGFLHIQGYDHRNDKEEKEMVGEEDTILGLIT